MQLQIYLAFARKSFQKQMQYRIANLAGLATNFFFLLIQIFVYRAFYAARPEPLPLNLNEVITYFALCQAFLMLMPLWGGRSEIANTIKDGSVALQLTKPVDFQAYWFADECGRACYYLLMRTLPTFLFSCLFFKIAIPQGATVFIAFAVSMSLAILMSTSLTVTILGTAFWTLDSTGVTGTTHSIITFFSGMLVPLALWPSWLAQIGMWLPFEGLVNIPFSIYLGKITGFSILTGLFKQMLWVIFFCAFGRAILKLGFSRLVIQGG